MPQTWYCFLGTADTSVYHLQSLHAANLVRFRLRSVSCITSLTQTNIVNLIIPLVVLMVDLDEITSEQIFEELEEFDKAISVEK